jgi:hypothetical protein
MQMRLDGFFGLIARWIKRLSGQNSQSDYRLYNRRMIESDQDGQSKIRNRRKKWPIRRYLTLEPKRLFINFYIIEVPELAS